MYTLQVCDYDEENEKKGKTAKKRYATGFLPRSALCEGIPRNKNIRPRFLPRRCPFRASRGMNKTRLRMGMIIIVLKAIFNLLQWERLFYNISALLQNHSHVIKFNYSKLSDQGSVF